LMILVLVILRRCVFNRYLKQLRFRNSVIIFENLTNWSGERDVVGFRWISFCFHEHT
jgi:hypothetical protein